MPTKKSKRATTKSNGKSGTRAETVSPATTPKVAASEQSEAATRAEQHAAGQRQQTRETSRFGSEPLWLHNARGIYRELGEDLDALSSGEQVDGARREQATGRLRKLSEAIGVRGRGPQKAHAALIQAIVHAIASSDSHTRHGKHLQWDARPQTHLVSLRIAMVDQQLGERLQREQFEIDRPLTEKIFAVLAHWPNDKRTSLKWPLLGELLQLMFPGADIPKDSSLRTTFQRKRLTKA